MKKVLIQILLGLFILNESSAQLQLEVVKNAKNNYEANSKLAERRFSKQASGILSEPDLVKYSLNDSSLSFRLTYRCSNCFIQVFEAWQYEGNSEILALPTGTLRYTKWANSISSFKVWERKNFGLYGGGGGGAFQDNPPTPNSRIYGINVWSGVLIDAIQVIYIDEFGNIIPGQKHGGNGGGLTSIILEKDEYIRAISGSSGAFLDHITFFTNKERRFSMGGEGGGYFDGVFFGYEGKLMGISGRCGALIDAIGFWGYYDSPGSKSID